MNSPKFLFGRMKFEQDGTRPVLMRRGTKYFKALFLDSEFVLHRMVLFTEEKYFTEIANNHSNLKEIKRVARFMRNKSKLTGRPRLMPKATRAILNEILELT